MGADFGISVRFYRLSEALQRYFTSLYLFDIDCRDGAVVEDFLHPEWAAMRFTHGAVPHACFGPGEPVPAVLEPPLAAPVPAVLELVSLSSLSSDRHALSEPSPTTVTPATTYLEMRPKLLLILPPCLSLLASSVEREVVDPKIVGRALKQFDLELG